MAEENSLSKTTAQSWSAQTFSLPPIDLHKTNNGFGRKKGSTPDFDETNCQDVSRADDTMT